MNKRKREEGGVISWVCTILMLVFLMLGLSVILFGSYCPDCETKDTVGGIVLWLMFVAAPAFGMYFTIRGDQHEETIGFKIFEFDMWSKSEMKYTTRYTVEHVTIRSKFIYHYHVGDYELCDTEDDVYKYLNIDDDFYTDFPGHKTKDAAMIEIISTVRRLVRNRSEQANAKIRNVKMSDVYMVDDIIKRLEAGEFDELEKKQKEEK